MIDLASLLDLLDRGGVLVLLLLIIVGGLRRWYVWGWHYDEVLREREEWRREALRGTRLGEQSTEIAARVLEQPPEPPS